MDPLYVKGLREAKGLLDAGTISAEDFEKEKRKLLSEREERERQEQEQEERRRKRPFEDEAARMESEGKRKSPEESGKGEGKAPEQTRAPAAADQAAPIPFLFPPPPSKWFAPPVFPMMPPAVHGGKATDGGCMCKSTLCLKLYCRCFRYGVLCTDSCGCVECYNDGRHEGERQAALSASRVAGREPVEDRGCRCKKSQCTKKYCECFGRGVKCTASCTCVNCLNGNGHMSLGGGGMNPVVAPTRGGASLGAGKVEAHNAYSYAFSARPAGFTGSRGTASGVPPRVEVQSVDLDKLKKEVAARGGLAEVDKRREWRQIARAMDLQPNSTAEPLRKRYVAAMQDEERAGGAEDSAAQGGGLAGAQVSINLSRGPDMHGVNLSVSAEGGSQGGVMAAQQGGGLAPADQGGGIALEQGGGLAGVEAVAEAGAQANAEAGAQASTEVSAEASADVSALQAHQPGGLAPGMLAPPQPFGGGGL